MYTSKLSMLTESQRSVTFSDTHCVCSAHAYVYACSHVPIFICICVGVEVDAGVFNCSPPYVFETGSVIEPEIH